MSSLTRYLAYWLALSSLSYAAPNLCTNFTLTRDRYTRQSPDPPQRLSIGLTCASDGSQCPVQNGPTCQLSDARGTCGIPAGGNATATAYLWKPENATSDVENAIYDSIGASQNITWPRLLKGIALGDEVFRVKEGQSYYVGWYNMPICYEGTLSGCPPELGLSDNTSVVACKPFYIDWDTTVSGNVTEVVVDRGTALLMTTNPANVTSAKNTTSVGWMMDARAVWWRATGFSVITAGLLGFV